MNKFKLKIFLAVATTLCCLPVSAAEEYSMQVFDAFALTGKGTIVYGRVLSGTVSVGDAACITSTGGETIARAITGIEKHRKILEHAETGQLAGLLVQDLKPDLVDKDKNVHGDCELPAEPQVQNEQ